LARIYGATPNPLVTSVHHQAIKTLGRDLSVEAISPEDNIIEAIRYTGSSFAFAVQWHPEWHTPEKTMGLIDSRPILQSFFEATRARKKS
jgi:putative glutamine amidotransferase